MVSGGWRMKRIGIVLLISLLPLGVGANGVDLALSNETAYFSFVFDNDPLYSRQNSFGPTRDGGSEFAIGGFTNESGDDLLHATLLARGFRQTQVSQYHVSAGMKLVGGEIGIPDDVQDSDPEESESVGALALGFQAGLLLRPDQFNPVELTFDGFFAPSITSFSDAESYAEVAARLQIDVTSRARAYIGYRRMRFDTNDVENITLDRSAHFGLSLSF